MLKKCKIVMLPTNQKTKYLMVYSDVEKTKGKLILNGLKNDEYKEYQNIYIISDNKIKEGDYCYSYKMNKIVKSTCDVSREANKNIGFWEKVIATTDKTLSQTNRTEIPQPSKQFIQKYIEEYNKGREIKEVLVEYEDIIYNPEKDREYQSNDRINIEDCDKLSRLKINPKDNTITIKKAKDSWTREEVKSLFRHFRTDILPFGQVNDFTLNKWIEENL